MRDEKRLLELVEQQAARLKGLAWQERVRKDLAGWLGSRLEEEGFTFILDLGKLKRYAGTLREKKDSVPLFIFKEGEWYIGSDPRVKTPWRLRKQEVSVKGSAIRYLLEKYHPLKRGDEEHLRAILPSLHGYRRLYILPEGFARGEKEREGKKLIFIYREGSRLEDALHDAYPWLMQLPLPKQVRERDAFSYRMLRGMAVMLTLPDQEGRKDILAQRILYQVKRVRERDTPEGAYARFLEDLLQGKRRTRDHGRLLAAGPAGLERILTQEDHTPRQE